MNEKIPEVEEKYKEYTEDNLKEELIEVLRRKSKERGTNINEDTLGKIREEKDPGKILQLLTEVVSEI